MHELGLTRNIVGIVSEAAHGRKVQIVTVEVGKLSGVIPEALAFCFDIVAEGTPIEGAKLNILEVEGRALCTECGTNFATPTLFTPCGCGSRRVTRLQGEELKIRSMELAREAA